MNKLITLLVLILLIASCGEQKTQSVEDVIATDNLEMIRNKRSDLETQYNALAEEIKILDEAIHDLDTTARLPLVTTFVAKREVFNHFVELQGNVKTKENIIIYPEIGGILKDIYVKEGQQVNAGQILAIIDDGGLSQQVAQMEIQEELAKTTFERQERLWNQKIGSEMTFLQSKSNYEAQQRAVKQMKAQLEKTSVRAPFSGVIDDVITEKGSLVSPGQSPLIRIVNLKNMYIEADVPESYISDITRGKKVEVDFPILDTIVNSIVRQAGNFINPANRTFKVEVDIPNNDEHIKPNLTAKLRINDYKNPSAILVPQSIISENAQGEQYVYLTKNKQNGNEAKTEKVFITTGKTQGDFIEVLSGLEDGAEIIQEGARSVRDGQLVKVLN